MKRIIYVLGFLALLFTGTTSFSQLRKIPAEVTGAFSEKYPHASDVEWRDKLSGFTASFKLDSVSYLASFTNKGEWESTEESIELEEVPDAVQDGFGKSRFADWNVESVSKIELPDNQVHYKLEVAKGDIKKRNLYFNSAGRLLKDRVTL